MEREADVSGILSQTVDVIGAAGRAVLIYVVVLGLFNGIGGLAGLAEMDDNVFSVGIRSGVLNAETLGLAATLYQLLGLVLYVVAAFFLLRQMLEQIGRPARGGNLLSYVAMSVLAMIGLMIGFVLLVIPGLILLVRWSAANGFLLSGDKGITGALGTSWVPRDSRHARRVVHHVPWPNGWMCPVTFFFHSSPVLALADLAKSATDEGLTETPYPQ